MFTGFQPSPLERTVTRAITTENTGSPDPALDFLMRLAAENAKELWRKAHIIFYQSPWAWDPQSKEAQEFILSAAAVRNDLERHTF
jgi:hypothetical protein